ncbi:MAG: type II secretion system protein N [Sphingomonas sp.]|uniref:type II secretion system protein N n=1 Tax=Sphingomonas sp. CD22 TaxID=3100214 RepID=UPI001224BE90|nr:type II secretion system protein N [Sphingomonas sp. CD22]MEA1084742.1 type II secretion system protein N [Sphingomonas sp. CD22]RZL59332.1 MAG: type II secretion system protein N [Sphingomonas sp.]
MRRIRLRTGPAALFGALMLLALLVFLPLRLVLGAIGLGEQGFSARTVTGSVWDGRLNEARFGALALGSLDASLSPFALLIGRARVVVDGDPGLIHGAITMSRHGQGIDDMTATLPTGAAFAPLPVNQLALEGVTVHFADGVCDKAEGRVRARLIGEAAGIALPAELSGAARCDGGALLLPLVSQAGTEGIELRITGQGRYTAALRINPTDPAAAQRLAASGFVAGAGGYRLSVEGSF